MKASADSDILSELHAMLTQIAFQSGSTYLRWLSGLSVMIEKKENDIRVEKLRAIVLLEEDFNFGTKLYLGSRMVHHMNNLQIIPSEMFGSRPQHTSIDVPMCRILFFEIIRQRKINAALGSYDAQSCYDNLTHSYISLSTQAIGLPISIIITTLITLQYMKFYLRTGFGDSSSYYSSKQNHPYQGMGQGNGASPAVWLLISSLLINMMKQKNIRINLPGTISSDILSYVALLFVDDGDFPTIALQGNKMEDVIKQHQKTVTIWSQYLKVTGGSLSSQKFYWYPIQWEWNNGIASIISSNKISHEIYIKNLNGKRTNISKYDSNESCEVMGVWQSPLGTMEKQQEIIKQK